MSIENFNEIKCPACHQITSSLYGEKNNFNIFICNKCNTLYSSEKESTAEFDYKNYYNDANLDIPDFVTLRLREIVRTFEKYRQNNRFLDVGCGAGALLKAAIREQWEAEGVEVSQSSVEYLQKQNIKVFYGDLAKANFAENSFDVITAVEILEHISNPEILLKEIYRVLRPGGLLWATTPHGRGASSKLLGVQWTCIAPPEHLHLFSVTGIKKLLMEAGFQNISISTEGVNPFEIIHSFRHRNKPKSNENKEAKIQETENTFDRVDTAYELNYALSKSTSRRAIKNLLNSLLSVAQLGDSIKIRAEK